jgi:hypothetical protein
MESDDIFQDLKSLSQSRKQSRKRLQNTTCIDSLQSVRCKNSILRGCPSFFRDSKLGIKDVFHSHVTGTQSSTERLLFRDNNAKIISKEFSEPIINEEEYYSNRSPISLTSTENSSGERSRTLIALPFRVSEISHISESQLLGLLSQSLSVPYNENVSQIKREYPSYSSLIVYNCMTQYIPKFLLMRNVMVDKKADDILPNKKIKRDKNSTSSDIIHLSQSYANTIIDFSNCTVIGRGTFGYAIKCHEIYKDENSNIHNIDYSNAIDITGTNAIINVVSIQQHNNRYTKENILNIFGIHNSMSTATSIATHTTISDVISSTNDTHEVIMKIDMKAKYAIWETIIHLKV